MQWGAAPKSYKGYREKSQDQNKEDSLKMLQ